MNVPEAGAAILRSAAGRDPHDRGALKLLGPRRPTTRAPPEAGLAMRSDVAEGQPASRARPWR
jgi:hypothetical protein